MSRKGAKYAKKSSTWGRIGAVGISWRPLRLE
jgi:hypothetical protein